MSARLHRRGVLGLLGAGSAAMAAGGPSAAGPALGRLIPGFAGGRFAGAARALGPAAEGAFALDRDIPAGLAQLAGALDGTGAVLAAPRGHVLSEPVARAIAALAPVYPTEIAAPRSFGPPLRRRLHAELLARESARLAQAAAPTPTPPASPGPDA